MRKLVKLSLISYLLLLCVPVLTKGQISAEQDTFYVASWNIENLFDDIDDAKTNDNDFLPEGSKNWTIDKIETKLDHMAQVMNYMNGGCGPDIIGFMEVENSAVIKPLAYKFNDRDYIIAHRDSPDERGIDNVLFYDRNKFMISKLEAIHVDLGGGDRTRDILHVSLALKSTGEIIHVFVNHWPSRLGGIEKSEGKRIIAAGILKSKVDSLLAVDPAAEIIIMGDFNDEPGDRSLSKVLNAKEFNCQTGHGGNELLNLASADFEKGNGTLMYRNDWEMFDQIIVNGNMNDRKGIDVICGSFGIVKPPFMVSKHPSDEGAPIPTFKGRKYLKGYSDHFPVAAKFINNQKAK